MRSTSPARAASDCARTCASQRCCQSASFVSASRNASCLRLVVGLQACQLRFGIGDRTAKPGELGFVRIDVVAELGQCGLGFVARALQALAHLALVSDLLLDARERAADFVALGLCLAQRLRGFFAADTAGFDLALGFALLGDQLLQPGFLVRQLLAQRLHLRIEPAELQGLPFGVADFPLALQHLVLLGLARLALEVFELLADFLAQVVEAVEVLARMADAGFGFLAALLVLGDAGGFLEIHAQVFRPRLDDLADHPLLDDRIAARSQARAQEQVGDVAPTTARAIEVVVAGRVATDGALDRNLVEGRVLAGDRVVGVVEHQFDRRLRHRLARGRSREDHVGQRIASQPARRAFAHHPADRVDDVGLAATVRPHHAGHVGRQVQRGRIDEGFETGQLDRGQAHAAVVGPRQRDEGPRCDSGMVRG